MIQGSHDDSLILWIRKQIIQTHETHIRHCHSYLKIRRKKLFLDFFLNKTSEDIQCSLRWFHRNLLGWPLWSPSISSIESVKVSAAEVEDRETVDGALVRGCSSSESQPAPVGGGQSRWTFAEKLFFVKYVVYILKYWYWIFQTNYMEILKNTIYIKIW